MRPGAEKRTLLAPPPSSTLEPGPAPTFSVAIAAHNAAATVAEAVDSALTQTRPPLEVIVVDDGSADDTAGALEPYRGRVVYVRTPQGGAAAARNAALERARGDFLAILDADDAYLPERLEALTELAVVRPDLDILCTDAFLEMERTPTARFSEGCTFETVDQRSAILQRCFCVAPAYRRSTLANAGGFDESLRTAEDWECVIRLLHGGAIAGNVAEALYRYRLHDRSLTADRVRTLGERITLLKMVGRNTKLTERERAALAGSLTAQQTSLLLTQTEAALRSRSRDARKQALATARAPAVTVRTRVASLAAALAPKVAARALERREARHGLTRLRRNPQRGSS